MLLSQLVFFISNVFVGHLSDDPIDLDVSGMASIHYGACSSFIIHPLLTTFRTRIYCKCWRLFMTICGGKQELWEGYNCMYDMIKQGTHGSQ